MLAESEIATMAERICKTRDVDPVDAKAMLRQIVHDHGRDVALAVIEMCRIISQRRYAEAMAVFEGLPRDVSFADALRIKASRGDACAQGWRRESDGTFSKLTRCC
jgi:hypothetical protein